MVRGPFVLVTGFGETTWPLEEETCLYVGAA